MKGVKSAIMNDINNKAEEKLSDYFYELPKEYIAQYPCPKRDESKLMVVHRDTGKIEHKMFTDAVDYFRAGDVLVLNKTRVIPARLSGRKRTGGKIDILMLDKETALVKPLKSLKKGTEIFFDMHYPGEYFAIVSSITDGMVKLNFSHPYDSIIKNFGKVPLPPYIKRAAQPIDTERYQTVFARENGSVAAPTAGLHFTDEILKKLRSNKIGIAEILLHVSWATFLPVRCEKIAEHKMGTEYFEVDAATANMVNSAKRVIAVGTTSARTLESLAADNGVTPKKGITDIFIYPGYKFKAVDCLITNFHLPETTLIMLVCAFAGKKLIFRAYEEAKKKCYRFASYGDAMLIL